MTLYKCKDCRNWHSGVAHVCGPKGPDLRDQRTLEKAVVRAARAIINNGVTAATIAALKWALIELDGLDRPFREEQSA